MADYSVVYKIKADTSSFHADMSKLKDVAKGVFSAFESGMSAMLKVAGKVADAVVKIGKKSIESYAEYEQLVGGIKKLFGEDANQLQKLADNAFKNQQISANKYMTLATSFSAKLIKDLGNDTKEAVRITDLAISDMADNANAMGTDIETLQRAYQGFARDQWQMLDSLKLGYSGTKEGMGNLVSDANEILAKQGKTADLVAGSFDSVIKAIHIVQQEWKITGTAFDEASKTLQGSAQRMGSAWDNLLAGMANPDADIDKLLGDWLDSVEGFAGQLIPKITTFLPRVNSALGQLLNGLSKELPNLLGTVLPSFLETVGNVTVTLVSAFAGFLANEENTHTIVNSALDLVLTLAKGLCDPQTIKNLLDGALAILSGIAFYIADNAEEITDTLFSTIDAIVEWFTDWENIKKLLGVGVAICQGIGKGIIQGASHVTDAFNGLIEGLRQGLNKALNPVQWFYSDPQVEKSNEYGMYKAQNSRTGILLESEADYFRAKELNAQYYDLIQAWGAESNLTGLEEGLQSSWSVHQFEKWLTFYMNRPTILEIDGYEIGRGVVRNLDDAVSMTTGG